MSTSRRDTPKGTAKGQVAISELNTEIPKLLETIQKDMYDRAREKYDSHTKKITNWDDFVPSLNEKNVCMIPHCLTEECEDEIKDPQCKKSRRTIWCAARREST